MIHNIAASGLVADVHSPVAWALFSLTAAAVAGLAVYVLWAAKEDSDDFATAYRRQAMNHDAIRVSIAELNTKLSEQLAQIDERLDRLGTQRA